MKQKKYDRFQHINQLLEGPLEKRLILQERAERRRAKIKYVMGIQGSDGGNHYLC
jgi:hypothetical protein